MSEQYPLHNFLNRLHLYDPDTSNWFNHFDDDGRATFHIQITEIDIYLYQSHSYDGLE